ncbi:MAG: phosphatidate cytidylyltransferase, partial [Gammaproteobacteria bacterium]|nr:phosphatidate cytidylyltransferase [Gammaproteobacteria bacterium]
AFLGAVRPMVRHVYLLLLAGSYAASYWLIPEWLDLAVVLWAALVWWLVALVWILRYPVPISPFAAGLAGILVLVPAWISLVSILQVAGQGPALLLLTLAMIWAADIGAYFAGRRWGRLKLAPRVSPGKTLEGVAGGLLGAVLTAGVGGSVLGLPLAAMLPFGLCVAAISVVGDLTESMFKRSVGIKDSGRLFPGHGGVLDRIDSITAAAPLFALALQWMGRIPA